MAGALGMILGLGGGSLMAAAGEKHRRDIALEDASRQAMSQMFINHLEQHPELANVENFAKAAKKQFGSAWDTMLPQFQVMAAEKQRQLQSSIAMLSALPGGAQFAAGLRSQLAGMQGGGAGLPGMPSGVSPPAGGASGAPAMQSSAPAAAGAAQGFPVAAAGGAPAAQPQTAQQWREMGDVIAQIPADVLDSTQKTYWLNEIADHVTQAEQIEKEQRAQGYEIAKEQRGVTEAGERSRAEAMAKLDPAVVAGQARAAAERSAAEASAKLGVDYSPAAIQMAASKSAAEASAGAWARANVEYSPTVIKDAVDKAASVKAAQLGVDSSDPVIQGAVKKANALALAAMRRKASPEGIKAMVDVELAKDTAKAQVKNQQTKEMLGAIMGGSSDSSATPAVLPPGVPVAPAPMPEPAAAPAAPPAAAAPAPKVGTKVRLKDGRMGTVVRTPKGLMVRTDKAS